MSYVPFYNLSNLLTNYSSIISLTLPSFHFIFFLSFFFFFPFVFLFEIRRARKNSQHPMKSYSSHFIRFGENTRGRALLPNLLRDKLLRLLTQITVPSEPFQLPLRHHITYSISTLNFALSTHNSVARASICAESLGLAKCVIHSSPKLRSQNKLCAQM